MDLGKYWPRIPKTLCGVDLDSALAYTTVKQVKINDRRLGCFNYSWYVFVLAWVVGFQIFYGNNHYKLYDVKGTARITIQQPTKGCNPNDVDCEDRLTPFTELPYCEQYSGPKHPVHEKSASKCKYFDQHQLMPEGMLEGEMFIPTRIDKMVEERSCEPSASNGYSCKKMWTMVEHDEDVYVGDIDDFTVMLVSSYYRAGIRGTSTNHQGFYYECKDKKTGKTIATTACKHEELDIVPIKCINDKCKYKKQGTPPTLKTAFLSKRKGKLLEELKVGSEADDFSQEPARPDDSKDAFAIPDGDIMSVRKILELAGLELDGSEVAGDTLRKRGSIVTIKIQYANLRPMKGKDTPGYIYKVQERPMNEMKTEMYSLFQDHTDTKRRTIENRHGILLQATVDGSFGQFDIVFLLVMLTTSLALLKVGTTLVDILVQFSSYGDDKVEEVSNEYDASKQGQQEKKEDKTPVTNEQWETASVASRASRTSRASWFSSNR